MHGFERLWTFVFVVVSVTRITVAQTTSPVVCVNNQWTLNREGDTPCEVAAALEGACFNNVWNIPPIPPSQKYSGPVMNQSNPCQCNTVAFSLVAACGACQNAGTSTWREWISNCSASDITIGGFPRQIPLQTNVPAWAYIDITARGGNSWNATAAFAIATSNPAERTGGSPPATGIPGSQSASPPSATSSSRHSSSNAGPIAGGVIGGLVFLALLGLVGFFLYRRKHPRGRSDAKYYPEKVDLVGAPTPVSAAFSNGLQSPTLPMQQEPQRFYDPSDPSTFPTTPPPSHYPSSSGGYTSPTPSQPYPPHHVSPPPGMGGYTGAPEV